MSHVQLNCRTYRKGEKQQKVNKSRLSVKRVRVRASVYAWLCLGDVLLISCAEKCLGLIILFICFGGIYSPAHDVTCLNRSTDRIFCEY